MKLFGKTTLAVTLSVAGAVSSASALAMMSEDKHISTEVHQIEVIADGSGATSDLAKIFVDIDGEVTNLSIPKSSLQDKAALEAALADVPEELREKLLKDLGNIHFDENIIKIVKSEGHGNGVSWSSDSDNEHVFVIELDDGELGSDIANKVIKKFRHGNGEKIIEFKHGGNLGADSIIRLLEHGKYSADELDKIQQEISQIISKNTS